MYPQHTDQLFFQPIVSTFKENEILMLFCLIYLVNFQHNSYPHTIFLHH